MLLFSSFFVYLHSNMTVSMKSKPRMNTNFNEIIFPDQGTTRVSTILDFSPHPTLLSYKEKGNF
jgi:hypothetical protein